MKKLIAAGMISLSGLAATAGSITYEAPNVTIEMEPSMNVGLSGWLIPLVILAVFALAATSGNSNNT